MKSSRSTPLSNADRTKILAHSCRFLVLTGGPGAGKTAVMEAVRQIFCEHVAILPESASIVYGGGFPRKNNSLGVRSVQKAIFHVQTELENYVVEEAKAFVALCDRGVVDGYAYWPKGDGEPDFFSSLGCTKEEAFARYHTVIHMRTPSANRGYDLSNPVRIESPEQAAALDAKIEAAWDGHPNRIIVDATERFTDKVEQVTKLILAAMPNCCPEMLNSHEIKQQKKISTNSNAIL